MLSLNKFIESIVLIEFVMNAESNYLFVHVDDFSTITINEDR